MGETGDLNVPLFPDPSLTDTYYAWTSPTETPVTPWSPNSPDCVRRFTIHVRTSGDSGPLNLRTAVSGRSEGGPGRGPKSYVGVPPDLQ